MIDPKYTCELIPGNICRPSKPETMYWVHASGRVYWGHHPIRGADPATFRFYLGNYGKDARHAYCQNSRLRGADGATFHALSYTYYKDHQGVWAPYGQIKGADAATFEACDDGVEFQGGVVHAQGYARDKDRVYYKFSQTGVPRPVKDADPVTFVSLNDGWFGRDAARVYSAGYALRDVDIGQWRLLGCFYSTDGRNIYFLNRRVRGARTDSFRPEPAGYIHDQLARDAFTCY